jgi:hypothetical protein
MRSLYARPPPALDPKYSKADLGRTGCSRRIGIDDMADILALAFIAGSFALLGALVSGFALQ